jgi:hypothetical protein
MNWKIFLLKFLRNVVVGLVIGMVALSIFGYLLAGKEGAANMTYWGLALGLLGGFASGIGVLFEAGYWGRGENIQNLPEWNWFVKKDEERKNSPRQGKVH